MKNALQRIFRFSLFTFHFSLFTCLVASSFDYGKLIEQKRAEIDAKFKNPALSPLPAKDLAAFKGLSYFPVNESYRVRARWVSADNAPDAIGRQLKLGELNFTLAGAAQTLAIYAAPKRSPRITFALAAKPKGDTLVVAFKDATNGNGTQREGRTVELERLSDSEFMLDFNLAANAACAYNADYACPVAPRENVLAVAIPAGEKAYQAPVVGAPPQSGQLFSDIGWFNLINGQTIRNCRIGYRTFGTLNASKSNAVLFPAWFMGKSEQLAAYIGADKMVDPNRYFIIATDGLGNGVSSSPSNTTLPAGNVFPRLTIRDLVNADRELLTQVFGVRKLNAVIGISMGGMEAFEWLVAYPDLMEKAVAVLGTPQMTSVDKLLWTTELKAIEEARRTTGNGDNASALVARIHATALVTPSYRNRATPANEYEKFIEREEANYKNFKSADWAAQLQAMIDHDITRTFGYTLLQASWQVKAQLLVVVSREDHMVNPEPAREFARLVRARVYEINNDCGHVYANCEGAAAVNAAVAGFLNP